MKKMLCAMLLVVAATAFAHHSPAVFDLTKQVKVVGVVKEFRWTNPHSWIELDVRGPKGAEAWAVEMTGPTHLVKAGWKSTTLKPGDEVTITVNPLRTDEKVGKFVSVTFKDGRVLSERAGSVTRP